MHVCKYNFLCKKTRSQTQILTFVRIVDNYYG